MMDGAISKRYAQALFELAEERQETKKVEAELLVIRETMTANPDLVSIIYHQLIAPEEKKKLIEQLFTSLTKTTLHFLYLLIDRRREKFLEDIIGVFHEMCLEMEGVLTAEVKTAAALSPENREALKAKFATLTGKKVELQEEIDASLIGGLVVTIGDKVYNGSLSARLDALQRSLEKA